METTIQKADTRKTTNLLKKHLKQLFGIDASVRSESYSGGSSLRVSYKLGPDESVINDIVKNLQYGYFDGMTDEYRGVKVDPVIVDGYELNTYKFVFVKQEISHEFKAKLANVIKQKVDTSKRGRDDDDSFVWDIKPRHFVTQNENEVELLSVDFSRVDYTIKYKLVGDDKVYSTDNLKDTPPKKRKTTAATVAVEVTPLVVEGEINFVEYSDKAFALTGLGTKAIKDELAKYGNFNRFLKCGPGWIFAKKHEATIRTLIGQ